MKAMATCSISYYFTSAFVFVLALEYVCSLEVINGGAPNCGSIEANDTQRIEVSLNLKYLEAEWFLHGAFGKGLDQISPELTQGGPPPTGAQKANLHDHPLLPLFIQEFGYQKIGHIRAITTTVGGFPRPLLDLSRENFAKLFDQAVGFQLSPPSDPYANSVNYLLASYAIPYAGVGYVGTIANLITPTFRILAASLLGVDAGQDAVKCTLLYERANKKVHPYNLTVADFTNHISALRNNLGMCGNRDEGIIVPETLGAENKTITNFISADVNSLSYSRKATAFLRVVYAGNESQPGGFFPKGANGR